MVMDALKNPVNNVPGWLQRLNDLSGEIDKRQAGLAAVAAAEGKGPETKSSKRKYHEVEGDLAQMKARKKIKLLSPTSNKDAPAAYRTRNNVIVYYDNYAGSFFAKLAHFVWSSQNLMRKAKMAARVAQIKKLAEQDVSEDGNNKDALASIQYMSSRRLSTISKSRPGAADQPHDVYDNLHKGLEFVQSQRGSGRSSEMAKTEMERVEREEPELAKEIGEMGKVRTRRPISMRRDIPASLKEGSSIPTKELDPVKPTAFVGPMAPIEIDRNIIEAIEGSEVEMELLKLQYRSTRAMRSCGP
ncbi:hypothetical protein FLAG1_11758 [Fusarium langsethiae]|uniref:Uncharacterized protein n=1 Tax=Fusarium langsethiae TaxID=179993 RepID=A0A0M9ELJ0_FUSLA|nr:hypothetical protein FLAG1_11758 [Fusarium langsethiae]GKU09512.1 unnamed protein product [Fusarium langsethiae]